MAQPIYKTYIGKPREAWYQLSKAEQEQLFAKIEAARTKFGVKEIINCDSSWSSDQWLFFGVEEYPNIEAVQQYHAALNEINWFRYIDGITVLGTKV